MTPAPAPRDPRIDAYVTRSPAFAQPILQQLRELVHQGCPQVQETIKWGMPSFEYKGLLCGIAAFKRHCTMGFWKHDLLLRDAEKAGATRRRAGSPSQALEQLRRIQDAGDLPAKRTILALVRKAVALNEAGVKVERHRNPRADLAAPPDLAAALKKNPRAAQTFDRLSHSHKRDYIEWLTEAKRPDTRSRRLATAIEWLAEGKTRNWKYERR